MEFIIISDAGLMGYMYRYKWQYEGEKKIEKIFFNCVSINKCRASFGAIASF